MDRRVLGTIRGIVTVVATACLAPPVWAVGTAFTYQGRLEQGGAPANATCDFQFSLFDALANGLQVGTTQTAATVAVADGLFTVSLDFGGTAFTGPARFLQTGVRCPAGADSYTVLAPRTAVTATPYALFSTAVEANAVNSATVADGSIQSADLAGAAVTNAKLGSSAVTSDKILDGTVGSADLGAGAVTTAKIAPGTNGQVLTTIRRCSAGVDPTPPGRTRRSETGASWAAATRTWSPPPAKAHSSGAAGRTSPTATCR